MQLLPSELHSTSDSRLCHLQLAIEGLFDGAIQLILALQIGLLNLSKDTFDPIYAVSILLSATSVASGLSGFEAAVNPNYPAKSYHGLLIYSMRMWGNTVPNFIPVNPPRFRAAGRRTVQFFVNAIC